jgi:hypothetical protein
MAVVVPAVLLPVSHYLILSLPFENMLLQNKTQLQRPPDLRKPQSRQSAQLFLQSSELGLPHPLTRRRLCTPLWFREEGHTRLWERESQLRRGDRHCGTLGIYCKYFNVGHKVTDTSHSLRNLVQQLLLMRIQWLVLKTTNCILI